MCLAGTLMLGACTSDPAGSSTAPTGGHGWRSATEPLVADAVDVLPAEQISTAPAPHLDDGVPPPTSRWYSGLAFSADPVPVYPYPIAFLPRPDGFTVQRPAVAVSPTSIAAPLTGGLAVPLGATDYRVVRADPVSVTVAYSDGASDMARVTIAEGSPIVALVAEAPLTIPLPAPVADVADGAWSVQVAGVTYLLVAREGAVDAAALTVPAGASLQIAPLPEDGDPAAWVEAIGDPMSSASVEHRLDDDTAGTRIVYGGTERTVVVPFAGRSAAEECALGTYDTPYGRAPACAAASLEWSVPRLAAHAAYDLGGLDDGARADLAAQAEADLAGTPALAADTYFGGKGLARLASLLALARALGDDDLARQVSDRLVEEILPWTAADGCAARDARCFVYDDRLQLVVGKVVGFGAEDGNDHHFHYGYFLYAAAVLAAERPDLVDALAPTMDALAADIAGGAGDALAGIRVFDPYRGHSWAAGLAPFADGNNQESSSEAVAAWNGLALWADATADDALRERALWLLSSEADAARALWLEPEELPEAYAHTIASISWGDKRDYATWFSAEPSAILGIQVLPLTPVSLQYLGTDPSRVAANVADAGGSAFTGALGDYVVAYSALAGPDALADAQAVVDGRTRFDDGWSKALAQAWLAAVRLRSG